MPQVELSPLTVSGSFDKMGESLKALREYAVAAAQQAGLKRERVEGLRMAMDEYATNIITYGYHDAGIKGDITVHAEINDDQLVISLYDTAVPYDPTIRPDPSPEDLDSPLEERGIGGYGIMLTRQSVDNWLYRFDGKRNCNHFVLNRN
jgi:anti-sigma regulatory factor (Ser/Thr protein kinase)